MNILSLFDGISCGQLAMRRAGVRIDKYFASEIDKYAIQVTQKNFPNTIQLGDVTQVDFSKLPKIDILIGGSPCQDLSVAKNDRKGLKGERSGLFFEYIRALETLKPKYFLLENVYSMSKADKDKITEIIGVEPIMINSALLSAQQRKRYYWTNIANVSEPKDKGVFLKSILIDNGTGVSARKYGTDVMKVLDKSHTLMARDYKGFGNQIMTGVAKPICVNSQSGRNGKEGLQPSVQDRIFSVDGKMMSVNSSFQPRIAEPLGCALRTWPRTKINDEPRIKRPEIRHDGKSNALTLVNTDSMICEPIRVGHYGKGGQGQRIYSVSGKSVCLGTGGANQESYKIDLPDGDYVIRRLLPIECERLQTLPDNYTDCVSNTQRYKCIGNGWTVDVIAHILSFMDEAGTVKYGTAISFFDWCKSFRKRA